MSGWSHDAAWSAPDAPYVRVFCWLEACRAANRNYRPIKVILTRDRKRANFAIPFCHGPKPHGPMELTGLAREHLRRDLPGLGGLQ